MAFLKILVPGPWWHKLTYESDVFCDAGQRVLVPIGRGERVGLCVGAEDAPMQGTRKICAVIDAEPVLPADYIRAARIVANAFLCSTGDVLRTLLPSSFWRGEAFPAYDSQSAVEAQFSTQFFYRCNDTERWQFYRDSVCAANGGALVLFPEREQAKRFHKSLVGVIPKERLILWPVSSASATMKAWKTALSAECPVIIGGPGAAAAPLKNGALIIVEEEASLSWRSKSPPVFSLRSFAASRARILGGHLIFGGRTPSSRIFTGFAPQESHREQDNNVAVRVIDLNVVSRLQYQGVQYPLPLSDILLADTLRHVGERRVVFWLLDRRGVSGEIRCADCGRLFVCERCGTPFVMEKGSLRCPLCGNKASMPERCPGCGGRILEGGSPGLELLRSTAENLLNGHPVVMWHGNDPANLTEARKRLAVLKSDGGLVLGSRRALTLLDSISPALLAWLDADAEARRPGYMSRFYAYSMLLESCWRGGSPRDVLLQTRSFSQPWIRGVQAGWSFFWNAELKERSALGFPPSSHLVEIETPANWGSCEEMLYDLDEAGFLTLSPGSGRKFTVFTPHMAALRRFLAKYFMINRSRLGFPRIEVWSD